MRMHTKIEKNLALLDRLKYVTHRLYPGISVMFGSMTHPWRFVAMKKPIGTISVMLDELPATA